MAAETETHDGRDGRLTPLVVYVWSLLTLPPTILHELTHAAIAAPWADETWVLLDAQDIRAVCGIEWGDVPDWVIVGAHYGPLVIGTALGGVAVALAILGHYPDTTRGWLVTSAVAVWWWIYTMPSGADREMPDDAD